jgi:hypothetical protein
MTIKERLLQIFTEPDGATLCPTRVAGGLAISGYHGLLGFMLAHQHYMLTIADLGQYSQHMTILGSAVGVAVGIKSVLKGDASAATN